MIPLGVTEETGAQRSEVRVLTALSGVARVRLSILAPESMILSLCYIYPL